MMPRGSRGGLRRELMQVWAVFVAATTVTTPIVVGAPSLSLAMGDYAHTLTVRYAETDSQGVVFNSHYQALCDAVFDLWVRDRMGKAWQKEEGVNFSMEVASRFQYRSPAVFLDELTIRGEVTRWGRTSFEVSWLGDVRGEREGEPQRRVFEGVMTYVCVDGDRKPTPVDATFRANMPLRDIRARL